MENPCKTFSASLWNERNFNKLLFPDAKDLDNKEQRENGFHVAGGEERKSIREPKESFISQRKLSA